MTNKFIEPIKTFLEITRENLKWVSSEIQHQYFLSNLRDIEKKYPELHAEVEAFTKHLDAFFYGITDEDCPDFIQPLDDSVFETEEASDALKFAEKMQELRQNRQTLLDTDPFYAPKEIEDGLNEPRYPYDTEPSA